LIILLDSTFSLANLAAAFAFNFLIKSLALDLAGTAAAGAGSTALASALGASTAGAASVVVSARDYFGASTLVSVVVFSVFFFFVSLWSVISDGEIKC